MFNDGMDVPIIHTLYTLYDEWQELLIRFPKTKRHTLGQTIDTYLLGSLEHALMALWSTVVSEKITNIKQAANRIDVLKLLMRMAKDTHCVSNNQYLSLTAKLVETGKMVGGWMRDCIAKEGR